MQTQSTTYEQWMDRVDAVVQDVAGVSVHDLPDFPSRDWYDAGRNPREVALTVLEDNSFDFEEDDNGY
jgi:hypothetical protein